MKILPRIQIPGPYDSDRKPKPLERSKWYIKCETCRHFVHPQKTGLNQPRCKKVLLFSPKILLCYDKKGSMREGMYAKHYSEVFKKLI